MDRKKDELIKQMDELNKKESELKVIEQKIEEDIKVVS